MGTISAGLSVCEREKLEIVQSEPSRRAEFLPEPLLPPAPFNFAEIPFEYFRILPANREMGQIGTKFSSPFSLEIDIFYRPDIDRGTGGLFLSSLGMKYFIYARKSMEEDNRQIMSIEAQLCELREFAAREKLEIVASLIEAKTAKEPGRIIFGEMLDRIDRGEADGILAWHADRLARNSIDGGRIIYMLDIGKIKSLKFPTLWFENTPQGKFMLNIAFGQSKYYVDNLSENVRRGHRQKLRNGIWPGFAPIGYVNNPKTRGVDVDPEKSLYIKKAFELYATGDYTLKAIQQFLATVGLRSHRGNVLVVACIQRMLKNSFYYGVFKYNGEVYEGTHEPIITKKLFDAVQQVMHNRGKKKRKRKHEFAFSGLMTCGTCGCQITAEKQKTFIYYRCTKKKQACPELYLREDDLVAQIKEVVRKVSLPDEWIQNMLAEVDKEKLDGQIDAQVTVQNLLQEKVLIEKKMEKLLDFYIEEKGIDPDEYRAKKEKLLSEKLSIQEKVKDFEHQRNNWLEQIRAFIMELSQAKNLLTETNPMKYRAFLQTIGSNVLLTDKKCQFQAKTGWKILFRSAPFLDSRKR